MSKSTEKKEKVLEDLKPYFILNLSDIIYLYFDDLPYKKECILGKWDNSQNNIQSHKYENRIMSDIVYAIRNPLSPYIIVKTNISILEDNLEEFKTSFYIFKPLTTIHSWSRFLSQACLCGSKNVAEFLLKDMKKDYDSEGCEMLFPYVASSNNIDWCLEIAHFLKKKQKPFPDFIFMYASDKMIDRIVEIMK